MVLYCIVTVHVEAGSCRDDGLGVMGEVMVVGMIQTDVNSC